MRRFVVMGLVVGVVLQKSVECAILRVGNPLKFADSKPNLQNVRISGVEQFTNHYLRSKHIKSPDFKWGDEMEYGIFKKSPTDKTYDLSYRGADIREYLTGIEDEFKNADLGCSWQPEYGAWMVETVPRDPYDGYVTDLLTVERSMKLRRQRLHLALRLDEIAPSMSNFPMLGVQDYDHKNVENKGTGVVANSLYISDAIINPHPRFGALTQNIRSRRGSNVEIVLRKDKNNANAQILADAVQRQSQKEQRGGKQDEDGEGEEIHMDAMAFGMGCCCLQVTMQARSDRESRFLHDQLTPLAPLFLALSAASPIFRGHLVDTDTRWDVIGGAVDDRTDAERRPAGSPTSTAYDEGLAAGGVKQLEQSRYSSVARYIAIPSADASTGDAEALEGLNDVSAAQDERALQVCLEKGLDPFLAKHVAHLFCRDPLVVFDDAVFLDNNSVLDHFDNIQSTNWRTIRWKPPALERAHEAERRVQEEGAEVGGEAFQKDLDAFGPGWRVEFRPLEIQLTDFENAAFSILIVLIARATLAMGYNMYMPLSKVQENMNRSAKKDAATEQKFWFRKNALTSKCTQSDAICRGDPQAVVVPNDMELVELTLAELFNGSKEIPGEGSFPGLIPCVISYLDAIGCDALTKGRVLPYLELLQKRASGELPTTARYIRNFVETHPNRTRPELIERDIVELSASSGERAGRGSSRVSAAIGDELCKLADDIGMGIVKAPGLVGEAFIENLNCCSPELKEPFLKDNFDKLVATNTMDCVQYVPTSKCSKDPDIVGVTGEPGPYLRTDIIKGPCRKQHDDQDKELFAKEQELEIKQG